MIIKKENITDIKDVYIHDFELTDFNFNFYMEKLSINLLSGWPECKDVEIIFKGVILLYFQNVDFRYEEYRKTTHGIYNDDNMTYYKKLIDEFRKNESSVHNSNEVNYNNDIPKKLNDNVMELIIQLFTGGEIRILCNEIIVNDIS